MTDNNAFRISEEKRQVLLIEDDIVCQEIMKASIGGVYDVIVAEPLAEEFLPVVEDLRESLADGSEAADEYPHLRHP